MRTDGDITKKARQTFTVIELLVVMAIIVVLATILVIGLGSSKVKAQKKASNALVKKIQAALTHYHSEFRDYPPDGYDQDPGWTVTANGVQVGEPPRNLKGTSALMYFLSRPLIKTWTVGADAGDVRNLQKKRVGPFLTLEGGETHMTGFKPEHPWEDNAYWDTQNYRSAMLVDAFGRPLCYDKVKTADLVFFQPDRFQNSSGGTTKGIGAHSVNYINNDVAASLDPETEAAACEAMTPGDILLNRPDPRLIDMSTMIGLLDGSGPFSVSVGSTATHKPKNIGGYDLWSTGERWADPRDDHTSWGN